MKICEDCRIRNNWTRQNPVETGDCDWCWTRSTKTSEMFHFAKERTDSELRRVIQEQRNEDFRTMANSLAVYHTYGVRAGQIDSDLTSQLKEIVVNVNGTTDWEASYLRRLRVKDAIMKDEIRKRDERPELMRV